MLLRSQRSFQPWFTAYYNHSIITLHIFPEYNFDFVCLSSPVSKASIQIKDYNVALLLGNSAQPGCGLHLHYQHRRIAYLMNTCTLSCLHLLTTVAPSHSQPSDCASASNKRDTPVPSLPDQWRRTCRRSLHPSGQARSAGGRQSHK
jgi:hypothetical protein